MAYEAALDDSGVAEMIEARMPKGGRPRQLSSRTVLLGVMLALDAGRPAQLKAAWRALSQLSLADKGDLGVVATGPSGWHRATYRQYEDAFGAVVKAIDPSPVPSFKGIEGHERASWLKAARSGIDAEANRAVLHGVVEALVEASVPEEHKSASSSLAIDWTDHETWSRPRAKGDPQPANDPDASWGHAKRNAPGAKDCLFYGYYAQVATMVKDERGPAVPEFVRRIAFAPPREDPAAVMASTLVRAKHRGLLLGDVLCDCGYSNRDPESFARPLRGAGARLVMDLHPNDRGPRGTFEGAVICNGQLYCPTTPMALLGLGPLRRGASPKEAADHDARCQELARYKFSAITSCDPDGYQRFSCPSSAGKLRCALKPASMVLSADRPSVLEPPGAEPRCCRQATITVPPQVNEKTRQAHDYPSAAHRASYARRTAAERAYASMADPSSGGIRRGWCRLFGLAKNTLMYALAVVVRNVRIAESFEQRKADETRHRAIGPRSRKRRRRYQKDGREPHDAPPEKIPVAPG
ncbi:MAG: hypothetical protein ACLQFX_11215 [Acidimicrobiales bacterium]